jgi:lysylphosphatidylglycerol synthetase-like protein (DUF2156 family)
VVTLTPVSRLWVYEITPESLSLYADAGLRF